MESAQKIFKKNKLKIYKRSGERDLFGYIKDIKFQNVRIWYLSPKEIIESVGTGVLDAGIAALDLLKNSEPNMNTLPVIKDNWNPYS